MYLSAEHHTRRGKFALLIILGLVVVTSVWFLQLRTLFRKGDVAKVNEHIASFQRGLQAEWDALEADDGDEQSSLSTAADAVEAFVQEELRQARVRDAVGAEVAEALGTSGESVVREEVPSADTGLPVTSSTSTDETVTE